MPSGSSPSEPIQARGLGQGLGEEAARGPGLMAVGGLLTEPKYLRAGHALQAQIGVAIQREGLGQS